MLQKRKVLLVTLVLQLNKLSDQKQIPYIAGYNKLLYSLQNFEDYKLDYHHQNFAAAALENFSFFI